MKFCYFKSPTFRGWDFFQHPRAIAISWLEDEGVIGLDRPGEDSKDGTPQVLQGKAIFWISPLSWTPVYVVFPFSKGLILRKVPKNTARKHFRVSRNQLTRGPSNSAMHVPTPHFLDTVPGQRDTRPDGFVTILVVEHMRIYLINDC
jgi:hypothetical protein